MDKENATGENIITHHSPELPGSFEKTQEAGGQVVVTSEAAIAAVVHENRFVAGPEGANEPVTLSRKDQKTLDTGEPPDSPQGVLAAFNKYFAKRKKLSDLQEAA